MLQMTINPHSVAGSFEARVDRYDHIMHKVLRGLNAPFQGPEIQRLTERFPGFLGRIGEGGMYDYSGREEKGTFRGSTNTLIYLFILLRHILFRQSRLSGRISKIVGSLIPYVAGMASYVLIPNCGILRV